METETEADRARHEQESIRDIWHACLIRMQRIWSHDILWVLYLVLINGDINHYF